MVDVRGDGSCWAYAVLVGLGLLDHRGQAVPSQRDLRRTAALRQHMVAEWLRDPRSYEGFTIEEVYEHQLSPRYSASGDLAQFGRFAGSSALQAVATVLGVDIISWNARGLDHTVPVVIEAGRTAYTDGAVGRFTQIWARMEDRNHGRAHIPLVHVRFDGGAHYHGCVPTTPWPYTPPQWLA